MSSQSHRKEKRSPDLKSSHTSIMLNCAEAPPGMEALSRLKSTDPPVYLTPSLELSQAARVASQFLFSSLGPFTTKSPFNELLVDGFDCEQIWQQIDLQSQPLISALRREVRKFEKNPNEIFPLFGGRREKSKGLVSGRENGDAEAESDDFEALEGVEDEEFEGIDDDDDDENEDMGEDGEERENEEEDGKEGGVEDRFLKINELEEYLKADEAREYELNNNKKKGGSKAVNQDVDEDDEEEEEEDQEDFELGAFGLDEDGDDMENSRYEDFFGGGKKFAKKRKSGLLDGISGSHMDDDKTDEEDFDNQKKENMSTHEKELEKRRLKIEEMEKANLEPKTWTMQGEVTAATRPKNSALEVDLDFEHNVRPAPVITEEVTASIEELIRKRILEGNFDDVQKPPPLPSTATKKIKELDENKSNKGLAEIYEDEYVQKTGLVSMALSFSDEQKKEASTLFKKLCLKLDALSHFHFTPKPIIEGMSVQANVPALAMEEIAPVAVSDAAMLAPEEVFAGKGDVKEDAELTQADRKRRRANKKRKFKAEAARKMSKKALKSTSTGPLDGKEGS